MKVDIDEKIIEKEYIIERLGERLTLYALYENCIELDNEVLKEGWIRTNITGYNELVQIHLGFEYDVEYDYVSKDHLEDLEAKKTTEDNIRKGHL